ncbi:MAG: twin-arginine translocase TatA/TatE family subunit [Thermomicrobiales bacterium]
MEFFGVGAPELMVILVIAIVLFGPDKIPTMAAQVGKTIREFRRYTSELTKEFDAATGDLRQEFQTIAGDLKGELAATQADLRSQLDLTDYFKADASKETVAASVATVAVAEPEMVAASIPEVAPVAAATEPPSSETITVTTPYADALAASASTATIEAAPVEAPIAVAAVATKADPFADLATLVVDRPNTDPVTVLTPEPAVGVVAESPTVVSAEPAEEATAHTNGRPKVVGGSVSGSKYSRRKSR